jgi:hypothetical protein
MPENGPRMPQERSTETGRGNLPPLGEEAAAGIVGDSAETGKDRWSGKVDRIFMEQERQIKTLRAERDALQGEVKTLTQCRDAWIDRVGELRRGITAERDRLQAEVDTLGANLEVMEQRAVAAETLATGWQQTAIDSDRDARKEADVLRLALKGAAERLEQEKARREAQQPGIFPSFWAWNGEPAPATHSGYVSLKPAGPIGDLTARVAELERLVHSLHADRDRERMAGNGQQTPLPEFILDTPGKQ